MIRNYLLQQKILQKIVTYVLYLQNATQYHSHFIIYGTGYVFKFSPASHVDLLLWRHMTDLTPEAQIFSSSLPEPIRKVLVRFGVLSYHKGWCKSRHVKDYLGGILIFVATIVVNIIVKFCVNFVSLCLKAFKIKSLFLVSNDWYAQNKTFLLQYYGIVFGPIKIYCQFCFNGYI